MTLTWKNLKALIDEINPYCGKHPNNDDYEKLWLSIRTLYVFNFGCGNTLFCKMLEYDRQLYAKQQ